MRRLYYIIMVVVAALFCVECQHHDLYYAKNDYANVRINIDWSEAGLDDAPNGVTAVAYDAATGQLFRQYSPFSTTDHINIGLPVGTYDVVLFNNAVSEYQYINFLNTSHISTFIANGVPVKPVRVPSKADEDKAVIAHPEVIASSIVEGIVITSDMVSYSLEMPDAYNTVIAREYATKPQRRIVNVRVYCHTKGVKYAAGAPRTFFKHFSGGFLLGAELSDERQVIQEFVLSRISYDDDSKVDGTIMQEFTSFGKVTEPAARYVIDAEFTLVDGKLFGAVFDVTDQVEVWMDGYIPRIDIKIALELPTAIAPGDANSSFETDVEDWDNIIVGLPM